MNQIKDIITKFYIKNPMIQIWLQMPIIRDLKKQRQEEREFEVGLL